MKLMLYRLTLWSLEFWSKLVCVKLQKHCYNKNVIYHLSRKYSKIEIKQHTS